MRLPNIVTIKSSGEFDARSVVFIYGGDSNVLQRFGKEKKCGFMEKWKTAQIPM